MTVSDRRAVLALVAEAVEHGARQHTAWEMVGVAERTLQRWQCPQTAEDGRRGPRTAPRNTLSQSERDQVVTMAARPEFCNASPHQIVPRLADRGEYLASESSFYRVLKTHDLLAHRGRAIPAHRARPRAYYEVTVPRTLFSWDITYLLSQIRGQYFYLYLFVDMSSRARPWARKSMPRNPWNTPRGYSTRFAVKRASSRIRCPYMRITEGP